MQGYVRNLNSLVWNPKGSIQIKHLSSLKLRESQGHQTRVTHKLRIICTFKKRPGSFSKKKKISVGTIAQVQIPLLMRRERESQKEV